MNVVFDAYWWIEGPLSNRMVQQHFIRTWTRDYPSDDAVLVVPAPHLDEARASAPPGARVVGTALRPHAVAVAAALPVVARRSRADVVVSHNFTPLAGPAVTFVHDVLFQSDPAWFTPAERAYLAPIPLLARRARAVAASSATEAARIRARNRRLRRVVPVGITLGTDLAEAEAQRPPRLPAGADFVLTVGRLNVRKNLARTIEGVLRSGSVSPGRPLVVVGEPDGRAERLGAEATRARRDGTLLFLDRITAAELAWLYGRTRLFVCLSLGEGYGLPPVEARHFGAPVLVSDLPVFRETLADRAAYVDPTDTDAIATEVRRLLAEDAPPGRPGPAASVSAEWSACTARLRALAVEAVAG